MSYDINALDADDYSLYASFAGDTAFNPSNDSGTLGIYYKFVGFQPHVNSEGNSIFGNGRVLPIKIKLVDANLNPVSVAQPQVWFYQWSAQEGLGEILETPTSVSAADTGNTMRYVPEDRQYIYNWDLSSLENGTYAVIVDLEDSPTCTEGPYQAIITVAKKGKKKTGNQFVPIRQHDLSAVFGCHLKSREKMPCFFIYPFKNDRIENNLECRNLNTNHIWQVD